MLALLASGCGPGGGIPGVAVTTSESGPSSSEPLHYCVQLVADPPVTVDAVRFEPGSGISGSTSRANVEATPSGTDVCMDVCACSEGLVGQVVVEDEGSSLSFDVTWPAGVCCESGPAPTLDAGI